ncbi:MAG: hypothetical protein E6767_19350, partial [Dysgonomonas sp.]|nr:hypothetical protein [Dysgonomonas sp.]
MLEIKTTDTRILISKDGENFKGMAKNSLWYDPSANTLSFFLKSNQEVFVWEHWANGITLNGEPVTRQNYSEKLEQLFKAGGSTPLPTEEVERIKKLTFADLWNQAAGQYGKYNEETGLFEYCGLTDIGYEEAIGIYNYTNDWSIGKVVTEQTAYIPVKTNLPLKQSYSEVLRSPLILDATFRSQTIEVLNLASLFDERFGRLTSISLN